jgi:hypothetical protein
VPQCFETTNLCYFCFLPFACVLHTLRFALKDLAASALLRLAVQHGLLWSAAPGDHISQTS